MIKRKICVVTGTRAEYGLLANLMKLIDRDENFQLQIVVTGAHLSPEYGLTYQEILKDGFKIAKKVEMLLSSDTAIGVTKSLGLAMISFAEVFESLQPDLLILFGDRYEILAAAQAALVAKIPIAHIAGGDLTEGAFDDSIRHSITKMSHLHFVTNKHSAYIVRQLGEDPKYIYNVGSTGIDRILTLEKLNRSQLEKQLNIKFLEKNLIITFHPETLSTISSVYQFNELLKALQSLDSNVGLFFTFPNADPESREIMKRLHDFVATYENARFFKSLGQQLYFSLIAESDAVVGNSSSGIYEVPTFQKPTVNIGERQKGRIFASSVITCDPNWISIKNAINKAFSLDCSTTVNPYGDGNSSVKILKIIKEISNYKKLLKKRFYKVGEL